MNPKSTDWRSFGVSGKPTINFFVNKQPNKKTLAAIDEIRFGKGKVSMTKEDFFKELGL